MRVMHERARPTPLPTRRPSALAIAIGCSCAAIATAATAEADETPLTFASQVNFFFPEQYFPTMFRARDIDGDGRVDLAVAGRDTEDRLFILKGGVGATFTVMQTLVAEGFTDWLEFADIDADGLADLVTAWRGDVPRLVFHRGLGDGTFAPAETLVGIEPSATSATGMGRDPQGIAVGDFDGDGDVDVAVSQYAGFCVDVFTNNGRIDGAQRFERTSRVRLGTFLGGLSLPRMVVAGDVDGDGDLDLVANQLGGGRWALLRNEGGRFVRAIEHRVPLVDGNRPAITSIQLVDLDGDGDLDVALPALLNVGEQKVVAFMNDGTGRFVERVVAVGAPLGYAFSIICADLDRDGDMDAVTGQALPGGVAVMRRVNTAGFELEVDFAPSSGQLTRHLDAIDVDGDCDLDLIGIDGIGRSLFVRRNTTPQQTGCDGVAGGPPRASDANGASDARPAKGAAVPVYVDATETTSDEPARLAPVVADFNDDGVADSCDIAIWLLSLARPPRGDAHVSTPAPAIPAARTQESTR
jgi:hypothetical protein